MNKSYISFLVLASLAFACKSSKQVVSDKSPIHVNAFQYEIRKKQLVDSGAVVSAHPLASQVGLNILKQGGNAVDAAIATQLALAVVYPGAGNIGGGGFLLAQLKNGKRLAIDFREKAPGAAYKDMYLDKEDQGQYPDEPGTKQVFINAQIVEFGGDDWAYNEGCLSIPKIREDIFRSKTVTLEYLDENFEPQTKTFDGITGRIIQHEYDHIEGKLFIDYLKPLKRKLLKGKLDDITKGKVKVDYRMVYKP
jgi:hypothetical protein